MKTVKTILGIVLFWAVTLLGGGIVSVLMMLLDKIVPGYFGNYLNPLFCNLVAAVAAGLILAKLTDNNKTVIKINFLLAFVVTAILTVFQLVPSGLQAWLKFIGYVFVVIYFGVMCGKMMFEKDEKDKD